MALVPSRARDAAREIAAVDAGCVALLVLAVVTQGVVEGLGLPGKVELITDVATLALLVVTVVAIVRSGATVRIPWIVLALAGVLVVAAMRSDEFLRMLVSARNFLVLPTLALAIASLGVSERRSRMILVTALGLAIFEFGISIVQALVRSDVDLIVGSFGDYAGPSLAFGMLAGACLALGLYATGRGGPVWLLVGFALPVFSVWAAIRSVPIMLPVVGLAVAATAWWATRSRDDGPRSRRPLVVALTVILSTATVLGGYAIFRPSEFDLLINSEQRSHYLETGDLAVARGASGERIPGRGEQYRTAAGLINGDPVSFLFGNGLGATTYAENLGVDEPPDDERTAGYSDFGTMVVEVGWLGVALTVFGCIVLLLGCAIAARCLPLGTWTSALLLAFPGILVAMVASVLLGTPLRNAGSATLFWLLAAPVLAAVLTPRSSA